MRQAMAQVSEVPANPSKLAKAVSVSKFHMFKVQGVHVQGIYIYTCRLTSTRSGYLTTMMLTHATHSTPQTRIKAVPRPRAKRYLTWATAADFLLLRDETFPAQCSQRKRHRALQKTPLGTAENPTGHCRKPHWAPQKTPQGTAENRTGHHRKPHRVLQKTTQDTAENHTGHCRKPHRALQSPTTK